MRSFDDNHGRQWQAALLEASYGNISLVFSPLRDGEVRHVMMAAETLVQAQEQLAALDDDGLREQLAQAQPWP